MPILTFIRHGETNYNKEGRFTGQAESHLTQKGIKEAKEKAKTMDTKFDYFYRSPLIRTQETLDAIIPGKKALIDERIIETSLGEWEGKKKDELDQKLLSKFRAGKYTPPGAETKEHVIERTCNFIDEMFEKYDDNDKVFVVTHAGILRAIQISFFEKYETRVDNLQTIVIDKDRYDYYLKSK